MRTTGLLIAKTPMHIAIAHERLEIPGHMAGNCGTYRGVTTIPRGMVKSLKYLKE
jgi:hypothetical protein